jgi:signal transduction histidine kinase
MTAGYEHHLADLLEARTEAIVDRFVDRARGVGASTALPREEIIDSLREYIVELATSFAEKNDAVGGDAGDALIARAHARHRFVRGYEIGALVREYAALNEVLCDVIVESGQVPLAEVRRLFTLLIGSIAEAAVEYGTLRDVELRKQTAQHVAFLAHELRNPLSSAGMALALMRERGDIPPSAALNALERGLSRTAQLLDESLIGLRMRDVTEIDCSTVDMTELLHEIAKDSETDAASKELALTVDASGTCEADRRALRSAISNLVRNAVKFSHAGGEVQLRGRVTRGRLIVEVEDSCGGLPKDALKKLFDPFVQAGMDRSGFGLGLAIAKQVSQAHCGEIRVHDLPGKGCVFILDLPDRPTSCSTKPCDELDETR